MRLFKRNKSHYISWNILFLWGFGLWIALCTNNMYFSDILAQEGILFYQLNSNSGIPYNISTKPETIEDILHIMVPNTFSSVALASRSVLEYTDIFIIMCFMIFFICIQERIRKRIVWSDIN
ncbi:uncharacterized protein LOC143265362 isoform X2 [Megachile rotundata]|uniref:uncharacterized protein LOC143265362 isoform X2 n=1 Tax=Megachile rotundata TaxID=143995 RepID=UPI003FD59B69